jgi:2-hydroxy-6-oxonona-2,4-dienedioate hydrolase
MRIAFALVLVLHGIAHLVGFLSPWGLMPAPASLAAPSPSPNTLLGGRLTLGETLARRFGVIWLVVAVAFAIVAIGFWRREPWSLPALVSVTVVSLALSTAWWPATRIGVLVNVAILLTLIAAAFLAYRRDIGAERDRALLGSTFIETRYGPIEYATLGQGSPILVIHGTGGGWDQGIYAARTVVPYGFRLIAPSRFGYLRTPMPADPSPQHEADVWAALLDALKIDKVAVMSFSAGTAPAVQLVLRHPERVSSLVLFVPAAGGMYAPIAKGPPPFVMKVVLRYDLPMWLTMKISPNTMYKVAAVPPSLVPTLAAADRAVVDEGIRMILPVSMRSKGMMNDAQSQSGSEPMYPLESIVVPTMLLSAEDDLYRTLPVARQMAKRIPDARLMEFKTGGHFLAGHATELWPQVAAFLSEQQPDQATASCSGCSGNRSIVSQFRPRASCSRFSPAACSHRRLDGSG